MAGHDGGRCRSTCRRPRKPCFWQTAAPWATTTSAIPRVFPYSRCMARPLRAQGSCGPTNTRAIAAFGCSRRIAPVSGSLTAHRAGRGYRIEDYPAELAATADALGIDRFRVLGYSGGGPYSLAVAHALPDRVDRDRSRRRLRPTGRVGVDRRLRAHGSAHDAPLGARAVARATRRSPCRRARRACCRARRPGSPTSSCHRPTAP